MNQPDLGQDIFGNIKLIAIVAIAGFVGYSIFFAADKAQMAGLGQVLDRTQYVLDTYQGYLGDNGVTEISGPETDNYSALPQRQAIILLGSILVVALCGIVYGLIIGTVSSYLIGDPVYQFSLTIGFFMFAMNIGSYVSRFIHGNLIQAFIRVELVLAIVSGLCGVSLFMLFPFAPWLYTTGMFPFISTIGFLVGLEIPLLTRVLSQPPP